ncbi:MAG: TIGR01777 family oxidoreductase [Syntrophobacteraceae bacterium]
MKVLIAGGLGFVGSQLSKRFLETGHEVTILGHAPNPNPYTPSAARYVSADTTMAGPWQEEVPIHNLVINLVGASIFGRWNAASKKLIYDSRVLTTRNVADAMAPSNESTLLNTSAVGYYGFRKDEMLYESSEPGDNFLAKLCLDSEAEARRAEEKGARVVITRFGVVLERNGGALQQMISTFERFVGGPLGSGEQWFSWIHMSDLLDAIMFMVENTGIAGPVNCCSPNPVRNKDLAKELGNVLRRPSFLSMPGFMLRAILGEFASVLLEGQRVIPGVLQTNGFEFKYPELPGALASILRNR